MHDSKSKTISLALQGGGSHGAFTWGVLDRLLVDDRLRIEGISGASSGAMNAVVLAYGHATGGAAGARSALRIFWERLGKVFSETFYPPLYPSRLNIFPDFGASSLDAYLVLAKTFAPHQLNPMNLNPLRDLLNETIAFDHLRKNCPIKLFIAATQVRTGKLRIFENHELSIDTLMASACLPFLHHTVEIDGESYWDGGFTGNPPVFPLIFNCTHDDIIIVMVHTLDKNIAPTTTEEIHERVSDINFNAAFLREMRAIAFSKNMISGNWLSSGKLESRMNNINIHLIEDQALFCQYNSRSRYNTLPAFLDLLFREGYAAADVWLENNFEHLGRKSSVNLAALFC